MTTPNHYELLGVSPTATTRTISAKYRKLALTMHPDKFPPEERAKREAEFSPYTEARNCLVDPVRRLAYDRSLNDALAADDDSWGDSGTATAASTPPPVDLEAERRTIRGRYAGVVGGIKQRFAALRQAEQDNLVLLLAEAATLMPPVPTVADREAALARAATEYLSQLEEAARLFPAKTQKKERKALEDAAAADYAAVITSNGPKPPKPPKGEKKRLRAEAADRINAESVKRLAQLDKDEQQELRQAEATRDAELAAVGKK